RARRQGRAGGAGGAAARPGDGSSLGSGVPRRARLARSAGGRSEAGPEAAGSGARRGARRAGLALPPGRPLRTAEANRPGARGAEGGGRIGAAVRRAAGSAEPAAPGRESCQSAPMIDDDIASARTLPASFYRDPALFEAMRERVFARSWQVIDGAERAARRGSVLPFELLAG